ncbi:hypothetical protein ACF0JY_000826 [Escherichia coli]
MTTMNREEQKQVLIDTANHIIHRDNTSPYSENLRELARIALAALEVEPIGFRCRRNDNLGDWSYVYHREPDDFERKHLVIEGIYAAPPAPIALEAIENAIEYIRSIAFHIDEGDYHGKHIAYFMRQALAWLEGYSCRDDSQGKSDNSPLPRYQVIELTMLVKQLVSQLKKAKPDCKLPDRAMDYLLRNGLVSAEGVLR